MCFNIFTMRCSGTCLLLMAATYGVQGAGQQSFSSFMTTFGAVQVGAKNFFRLMKNDETVLLFPGGVREVSRLMPY